MQNLGNHVMGKEKGASVFKVIKVAWIAWVKRKLKTTKRLLAVFFIFFSPSKPNPTKEMVSATEKKMGNKTVLCYKSCLYPPRIQKLWRSI